MKHKIIIIFFETYKLMFLMFLKEYKRNNIIDVNYVIDTILQTVRNRFCFLLVLLLFYKSSARLSMFSES